MLKHHLLLVIKHTDTVQDFDVHQQHTESLQGDLLLQLLLTFKRLQTTNFPVRMSI